MNRGAFRVIAIALAAVSALVFGASSVLATRSEMGPNDIAMTRTYLRARHRYERAIKGDVLADEASARALAARVGTECPNVLAGALPGKATEEITREVDGEADQAFERPQRGSAIAFARRTERLRWSNRRLTYYVHGFAAEARAEAELIEPDLCADARAVAASNYKRIPASTTHYALARLCAISKVLVENSPGETRELSEIIAIMLKPYERPDERSLIPRRLSRREREASERSESRRVRSAESELEHALGLPEGAPPQPLGAAAPTCLSPPPR